MAANIVIELVTPEKVALETQGDFVVLPAFDGEMGVLPGHEPFMVQLNPGEVRVTEGGELRRYAISGGFAEVKDDKVSVFAEAAELAAEIDAERARQSLEKAKAARAQQTGEKMTLGQAEAAIARAQARLRVASTVRKGKRGGPRAPKTNIGH